MQSAIDKIVTKNSKTLLQYKKKTDKSRVPRLTPYSPAITVLKSILKKMTGLFNDPSMTVIKRPKNMKDIVVRAILLTIT